MGRAGRRYSRGSVTFLTPKEQCAVHPFFKTTLSRESHGRKSKRINGALSKVWHGQELQGQEKEAVNASFRDPGEGEKEKVSVVARGIGWLVEDEKLVERDGKEGQGKGHR